MSTSRRTFSLCSHLQTLHRLFFYSGLTHLRFDSYSERFVEGSLWRGALSTVLFTILKYAYRAFFIMASVYYFVAYLVPNNASRSEEKSIDVQDRVLLSNSSYYVYLSTFLFACDYLKYRMRLLPTLNELCDIFKELRRHSDAHLYFTSDSALTLAVKLLVMTARIKAEFWATFVEFVLYFNVIGPHSQLVSTLMLFSHVYAQLVLICFYMKMNTILEGLAMEEADDDILRSLLALSFRIARVKRELDTLHTSVFLSTFLGLFRDIYYLYQFLKLIVYAKYLHMSMIAYIRRLMVYCPLCFTSSYDMYVIGHLSNLLVEAERDFQRNLLAFLANNDCIRRRLRVEGELVLHQNILFGLDTLTYEAVVIDQRFSFSFFLDSIVVYVIMFLQFYASEAIYSQSRQGAAG